MRDVRSSGKALNHPRMHTDEGYLTQIGKVMEDSSVGEKHASRPEGKEGLVSRETGWPSKGRNTVSQARWPG